ncbi:uveal autoantigen with coiled-coil domains and ankyrin repeats protein-like isoform X2 [Maniola jurtina]|uniref:uveal autoantigen with coiled-coil domains and ankyrin repeats protein-like isoform X2 n=1 Tax=Maniola jurtina TaxID=191418 RepID=UPI001E68AF66|nr:uveal autoantigen with coiled-coil domains and ankyrin repeats protein-like isoform X2 [Maniola jurtina]
MEISNKIQKILTQRKLAEGARQIQAKISTQNKDLIKVEVNRDTALWQREQELAELKGHHERIQHNMLELQTQYEALSAQYQQELRYRPETLNKLDGTRKICELLEGSMEQLNEMYVQATKDQAMISDVYMKADLQVQKLTQMCVTKKNEAEQCNQKLRCQVREMKKHENQIIAMYNDSQKRAETALHDTYELQTHNNELQRKCKEMKLELVKENTKCQQLQEEKERLNKEMNYQLETIHLHEEELESLKQRLSEYDTKLHKVTLELSNTTELYQKNNEIIEKLHAQNMTLSKDNSDVATAFTKYREAAEEELKNRAITIEKTNNDLALKASEIIEMNKELQSEKGERAKLEVQIEKQKEIITDIQLKFEMQTTTALKEKEERCKLKTEIQKKTEIINEIKMELEEKRCALDQEKEERIKLDATLQTLKRDFEIESNTAKENERELKKRVSELEAKIRAKDEEITRELNNFLNIRNQLEKEKYNLNETITGLEMRICNIMKVASKTPGTGSPPEVPDDNAVTLTITNDYRPFMIFAKSPEDPQPPKRPRRDSPVRAKPTDTITAATERPLALPKSMTAAAPETKSKQRRFFKSRTSKNTENCAGKKKNK